MSHTPLEHSIASAGALLSNNAFPPSAFLMKCAPSHALIISCGCVVVDPQARRVALIHDPATNITQLPKGRKNIAEDTHAAALREAHEETGVLVSPLPLRIATRATPVQAAEPAAETNSTGDGDANGNGNGNGDVGVTTDVLSCEPVAVCYHRCSGTLAYKLVFWYAARGDSALPLVEGTKEAWEEQYRVEWVDARSAAKRLSMVADGEVVDKVLDDMVASGYDI